MHRSIKLLAPVLMLAIASFAGPTANAAHGQQGCPSSANKGGLPANSAKQDTIKKGQWHWYSIPNIPAGEVVRIVAWSPGDIDLSVCVTSSPNGHKCYSHNIAGSVDGCLIADADGWPGVGPELVGPMSGIRVGIEYCFDAGCGYTDDNAVDLPYVVVHTRTAA